MEILKALVRVLLTLLYRVEVRGLEHYRAAGKRVLIIANHTSFLDAALLTAFLPDKLTFSIYPRWARTWWVRPFLYFVDVFPMEPANPYALRSLIRYLQEDHRAVIFPEGRMTITGSLMKIYPGPGLVADKSGATVLPVRIEGAQYTPFTRLRGRVRRRLFPRIRLHIQPPRSIVVPAELRGRVRRRATGRVLADMMTEMMFATSNYRRTLFEALLDARRVHGGGHVVAEDVERQPLAYNRLIGRSFVLGAAMARATEPGEYVGLLLPNALATVVAFFGLHTRGRVPAMLNYSAGVQGLVLACRTARLRRVYSSRRFVQAARLEQTVAQLAREVDVRYLEDLRAEIRPIDKLRGLLNAHFARRTYRRLSKAGPDDPAVVLFTSGTEGAPKGVVLSHANLLANCEQVSARVDFGTRDKVLNALPLFHSFGLTAGALLPLFSGIKVFLYPSPLHYRSVPEIAYDIAATILFGTNTFLAGYARWAHPYDFYSMRYVFAGAEKLQDETRLLWQEKFGVRVFEGYGATETGPVLAANSPMDYRAGTVGRLLPGIEYHFDPVPGVAEGRRLAVRGPNVMRGYLLADRPGELMPPRTERGPGWYDTGDIVTMDADGFIRLCGRAKRFAKVGGEMVSLAAAEELAARTWPGALHACVSIPDIRKGEQLVLVTTQPEAGRAELAARARAEGVGEIGVPRNIMVVKDLPRLGSGKIDYPAVLRMVERSRNGVVQAVS
jgi:acyl-[acyl-carrier-protein]-phospholipid O-acyltransferase/long-chain-fatty-acid--[acyl-carrier-protein] ligase